MYMSIVFNSPDHVQERANVEPLTLDQANELVAYINIHDYYTNAKFKEYMQKLLWEYENLKHASMTAPNWISVNDAMPPSEENDHVVKWSSDVIVTDGILTLIGRINIRSKKWYGVYIKPTHWMPLPNTPKV